MGKIKDYFAGKVIDALFKQTGGYYNGSGPVIQYVPYNGEKTAGELGAIKSYTPDFVSLSARSWQAFTESDIAQLLIKNYLLWTIGTGLNFKAEPAKDVLTDAGIELDPNFIKLTESRFKLYLDSKRSTIIRSMSYHKLVYQAKMQAIIGGDCLIVLDYGRETDKNKTVSARVIDGFYIQSPMSNVNTDNGNFISNGVEINMYGEPVAYWILLDDMTTKRIAAHNANGTLQAWMVHGLEYRVDTYRGMPFLSCILEQIKKLDRYKDATLGSAEERAKIPYSVEHAQYSTGEDPLAKLKAAAGHGADSGTEKITNDLLRATASNIRYTTGKTVINMPIGATLKSLDNKPDLAFKDFFEANFDIVCATFGIPPEVALNKYTSSFSASMGAKGNWEFRVNFEREQVDLECYQPFYNYWLEMEIYNNRISAPGYVIAKATDDFMIVEAYQKCRFVGTKIPFIDKLKEINAIRAKLGDQTTPLMTLEQATEEANNGEWEINIAQNSKERELAKTLGFEFKEVNVKPTQPINTTPNA